MASWLCSNEQTQSYRAFIIDGIEWNGINVIFGSLERAVVCGGVFFSVFV